MNDSVLLAVDPRGIATLTLNRPECHNAIDRDCAGLLLANLDTLAEDEEIRAIVITGSGISFSAGHDTDAVRRMAQAGEAELRTELGQYSQLLARLDTLPKPTIARVQGSAFGLGAGLIACCDFAIGASDALFGFSEVRLGIIAGISIPYIVRAIGARAARRYLISSERFNAGKAKRLGLLHQDEAPALLDQAVEQLLRQLLINGPQAMLISRQLIATVAEQPIDDALRAHVLEKSLQVRLSDEGSEGTAAFIEHRAPNWVG
jgi:methylglutaconyl-CoA hydratase